MSSGNPPNIFEYAPKELSQDAFLCWLIKWANPDYRDSNHNLHKCAVDFVAFLIKGQGQTFEFYGGVGEHRYIPKEFIPRKIKTQYLKTDIVVMFEGSYLLIEDKTHSIARKEQVARYINALSRDNEFSKLKALKPVLFITGNQFFRDLEDVRVVRRGDFVNFLELYGSIDSDIFKSFYQFHKGNELEFTGWDANAIKEWTSGNVEGFFYYLCQNLAEFNPEYSYVPNARGGIYALYWSCKGDFYFQLEAEKSPKGGFSLSLYLRTRDGSYISLDQVRDHLIHRSFSDISCVQARSRKGKTMRVVKFNLFNSYSSMTKENALQIIVRLRSLHEMVLVELKKIIDV